MEKKETFADKGYLWYEDHNVSSLGYYNLVANQQYNRKHPLLVKIAEYMRRRDREQYRKRLEHGPWRNYHLPGECYKEARLILGFLLLAGIMYLFGSTLAGFTQMLPK